MGLRERKRPGKIPAKFYACGVLLSTFKYAQFE